MPLEQLKNSPNLLLKTHLLHFRNNFNSYSYLFFQPTGDLTRHDYTFSQDEMKTDWEVRQKNSEKERERERISKAQKN